jgi:hypothetical protein
LLFQKLFLLKFLCDEALKTPQVRAHLEKSVEVALELQQQLRDLVAERLKIVVPMDATNHAKSADKETLQKPQATSQQWLSLDATQTRDEARAVEPTVRLELQSLEVAEAPKATEIGPPVPSSDDGGDMMSEMKTHESTVGVAKVVHDLNLITCHQITGHHLVLAQLRQIRTGRWWKGQRVLGEMKMMLVKYLDREILQL